MYSFKHKEEKKNQSCRPNQDTANDSHATTSRIAELKKNFQQAPTTSEVITSTSATTVDTQNPKVAPIPAPTNNIKNHLHYIGQITGALKSYKKVVLRDLSPG
ncbi:hypothetical protein [Xenorhabdus koppenhoeferi]|uniref:Uncharacterized protein n=1 Tax=Xenorhabdus koppenhoeferi TaxID=351659 RepID=A0A1I7HLF4_9GAMM|nr:hypothetical protein [Xenorhabdus koppenhoeferi]SFU61379.1 hypothetical protein SAMN05421784_11517 [Xenorhabdus koppenhoeferi]